MEFKRVTIDGVEYDLVPTVNNYESLYCKALTGWEKVASGSLSEFWYIDTTSLDCSIDDSRFSDAMYDNANYFFDKSKAIEVRNFQDLWRKIKRFADEHNDKNMWSNKYYKYTLYYCYSLCSLNIGIETCQHEFGSIYFSSKEIAEKAKTIFGDDLIKYFKLQVEVSNDA